MITLNSKTRKEIAFRLGAKLEVRYYSAADGCGCWLSYDGESYPLEDDKDIRINEKEKYVVLDSVITGLTYGIFSSACATKFIKPYFTGNFNNCLDWVMRNTAWTDESTKIFEQNFCIQSKKPKPTADWVVYKDNCSDFWHTTIEPNFDCIKHKTGVERVYTGKKEKCKKKVEEHNSKFYVRLEDDDCVVYKDDMGLYHIESIHKLIVDEGYKQVYTGSYKECKAFIAGTSLGLSNSWHVIIDECGEYEILCGKREPNTLVVYEGNAQDCYDFTRRFKHLEKPLASFVKGLEKNNIPVDMNELTVRHLKNLARLISGVEYDSHDGKNFPILNLLFSHHFIGVDCQDEKYTAPKGD